MAAKLITKQTAKNEIDTVAEFAAVVQEWTQDYGYGTVKLQPAVILRNGNLTHSGSEFVLVLDGQCTEVSYGFYRHDNGAITLDAMHEHDE